MQLCDHDQVILEQIRAGFCELDWAPLWLTDDITIEITAKALRVDGCYPSTTPVGAQLIADELGACLWTPALADLVWQIADVRLAPHTQPVRLDAQGQALPEPHHCPDCGRLDRGPWALCQACGEREHSRCVDDELGTRGDPGKIVANIGKPWVICQSVFRRPGRVGQPYGWHLQSGGCKAVTPGLHVIQPVYQVAGHDGQQLDYAEPWRGWRWPGHEPAELLCGPQWKHICHDGPLPAARLP